MVKKILSLTILFLISANLANILNSYQLNSGISSDLKLSKQPTEPLIDSTTTPFVFSALPQFDQQIRTSVQTADARPEIIRQYLKRFGSPLEPYSNLIVELSDQNKFDYRWLVAIAQQESNLCKFIPEDSYNCWGWGIYGDKVTRFASYEDALKRIAPQFTRIFLKGKHYKDPSEVMKTYTPPSDGSWANGVSQFFDHLD